MLAATRSRREAILEAALYAFLDHGVPGASIEAICTRASASVGSVYHHFGDKAGIAAAVYGDALDAYRSVFIDVPQRHPDDAQRGVRGVVGAHLD